jgi:hypothetical protein
MSIKDEIARLSAENDRLICEHDQWMARREAAGAAPVQKSAEPAVLYREHHDGAPAAFPEPEHEPSGDDDEFLRGIERFADATTDALESDGRRISELERTCADLRGRVDTLVELLGQKTKLLRP